MNDTYLAIDFGGGSGRVIAGQIRDKQLEMKEIHRFPNRQIKLGGHVHWDFLALFEEMKAGIRKAVGQGLRVRSIGIDTWGVDFGLIDCAGSLLGNPQCYRDPCTARAACWATRNATATRAPRGCPKPSSGKYRPWSTTARAAYR